MVAILWDLRKCYENVRRTMLAHQCAEMDFPILLARLAIGTYAWHRIIMHHGAASRVIVPTSGIVAGCYAATTLLKAYMVKAIDKYLSEPRG